MSKVLQRKVKYVVADGVSPPCISGKPLTEGRTGVIVALLDDTSKYDVRVKFTRNETELFYLSEIRYLNNKEVIL